MSTKSMTVLEELTALSESLAECEERIGQLREEIASFQGTGDDAATPVVLPADWTFDAANAELNGLLQKRFTDSKKYRELSAKWEATKKAETQKKLASIQTRYKDVIVRLLQAACAVALAVKAGDSLIHEATTAGCPGAIQHCGPNLAGWSPDDISSWVSHWIREAIRIRYITGTEPWLAGIKF
jgi:hypothetical protein